MENEEAIRLIDSYLNGTATPQERARLESFLLSTMDDRNDSASAHFLNRGHLQNYRAIMERTGLQTHNPRKAGTLMRRLRVPITAAAVILISIGMYAWMANSANESLLQPEIAANESIMDVAPGMNKATLRLATGETIVLDGAQSGIVMDGTAINYMDGSELIGEHGSPGPQLAVLQTPRGGTYHVTLPDGTKVWINADSKLTYPTIFTGDSRTVELDGEGFFDVARNADKPFIVKNNEQEIQVLGTQFNLNSYQKGQSKTTLVSGSVRVTSLQATAAADSSPVSLMLKPGEQSTREPSGRLTIAKTDPTVATAWKDGNFHFRNTDFDDVMDQIARWYDIEVVYRNDVPAETFSGEMARSGSLRTVLRLLDASDVGYRIDGRRLIIQ